MAQFRLVSSALGPILTKARPCDVDPRPIVFPLPAAVPHASRAAANLHFQAALQFSKQHSSGRFRPVDETGRGEVDRRRHDRDIRLFGFAGPVGAGCPGEGHGKKRPAYSSIKRQARRREP